MRTLLVLVLAACLTPTTRAKVWTTVYRCDETTPLGVIDPNYPAVYHDVMVGTRLVFVVSSDTGGYWLGRLMVSWDEWEYGALSGRGYDAQRRSYDGSCLEAAGPTRVTIVQYRERPAGVGFDFNTASAAVPSDWFVFDYRAEQVGSCDVGLYDPHVNIGVPIEILSFTHVPSRDFNGDTIVDFKDLALLAGSWQSTIGPDPNGPRAGLDLNADNSIDVGDLGLFAEYWLDRTNCSTPAIDPHSSASSP